jgi:hypothetical protein
MDCYEGTSFVIVRQAVLGRVEGDGPHDEESEAQDPLPPPQYQPGLIRHAQ